MVDPDIYFLHGLDSSGKGTKGQFFARNFPQVIRPDFHGSLTERLNQLDGLCRSRQQLLFIGSSFGGLMAACYASTNPKQVTRLILLAPALNFAEYQPPARKLSMPTMLVVGSEDRVTPAELIVPLAEATFADLDIRIIKDDHLLRTGFFALNWLSLLESRI